MSGYHLAQVNIGRARAPMDDPIMKGFVDQLGHVNALADASPGFVWRLQTEDGNATSIQVFDDPLLIMNMSVWESLEALRQYVYTGDHVAVLRDRKQWFDKIDLPVLALWWIPAGQLPTPRDGRRAIETLQARGPTPEVFTFSRPFPAPSA